MRRREFEHEGIEHAVELAAGEGGATTAHVRPAGDARAPARSVSFSAVALGGGRFLVRSGDEVHDARVETLADGSVRVVLPQGAVSLQPLDPFRSAGRLGRAGGGARKILAPIPGRVLDVLVAVGDVVAAGQPVVIVEAMKMANELRSPCAGRVASLSAVRGAAVDAGATLAVIES